MPKFKEGDICIIVNKDKVPYFYTSFQEGWKVRIISRRFDVYSCALCSNLKYTQNIPEYMLRKAVIEIVGNKLCL